MSWTEESAGRGASAAGPLRLHVPGHKGGSGAPPDLLRRWGPAIFADDLTEVPGLDDLHAPEAAIRESQSAAARLLGARQAFYLVQGSTGGLAAMLVAAARTRPGRNRVLVPRYSHRALVTAAVLSGIEPLFGRTVFDAGRPLGLDVAHLRELLARHADECVAVCDLYPTAGGVAGDLAAVAKLAHQYDLPLLVDGAHAALFGLDPRLPRSPLELGADAVVLSAHKTLGSLGQSSLLLLSGCTDDLVPADEVAAALRLLTTTSPSYPLLLSLEAATWHATSPLGRRQLGRAVDAALELRRRLSALATSVSDAPPGWVQDPLRVNVAAMPLAVTGPELASQLREHAGVQVEASDWRTVLVVVGLGDDAATLGGLPEALQALQARSRLAQAPELAVPHGGGWAHRGLLAERARRLSELTAAVFGQASPPAAGVREAWFGPRESVILEAAVGRVSAEALAPYPPGVPVVWPGERLSQPVADLLREVLQAGGAVHGVSKGPGAEYRCQVKADR